MTMHWVELEGVRLPRRVGGHPALDFCNTWAGWGEPPTAGSEWLTDYERFVLWTQYAGLLDAATVARLRREAARRPPEAGAVLASALSLRTHLHRSVLQPDDTEALATVAGHAREAVRASVLTPGADGRPRWALPDDAGIAAPLLAVSRSAADLLTTADLTRVKACPGHHCGWLFLDRRGRRRWCSMAACGNRAKVRAHAKRSRG